MSRLVKGIKKVFKKVTKVVKKVAPAALAVGALVFTGGAALGLAPMAGGWSAAASTIASKVGASGVIGSALTGAVTQAGYGALIGRALGGREGMKRGAAAGLLTGAATGTINALRASTTPGAQPQQRVAAGPSPGGAQTFPMGTNPAQGGALIKGVTPGSGPTAAVGNVPTGPGLLTQTPQAQGFFERNKDLIGQSIAGLGEGMGQTANAEAYATAYGEQQRQTLRESDRLDSAHYEGADPNATYRSLAPGRPRPRTRALPWKYDPSVGAIVRTEG